MLAARRSATSSSRRQCAWASRKSSPSSSRRRPRPPPTAAAKHVFQLVLVQLHTRWVPVAHCWRAFTATLISNTVHVHFTELFIPILLFTYFNSLQCTYYRQLSMCRSVWQGEHSGDYAEYLAFLKDKDIDNNRFKAEPFPRPTLAPGIMCIFNN